MPRWWATVRNPACLPEQLFPAASVPWPAWTPHSSSSTDDADAVEPRRDRGDVARLAVVRRARQGELDVGEGEGVGRTGLHQRKGLERLHRRPRVHEALDDRPTPARPRRRCRRRRHGRGARSREAGPGAARRRSGPGSVIGAALPRSGRARVEPCHCWRRSLLPLGRSHTPMSDASPERLHPRQDPGRPRGRHGSTGSRPASRPSRTATSTSATPSRSASTSAWPRSSAASATCASTTPTPRPRTSSSSTPSSTTSRWLGFEPAEQSSTPPTTSTSSTSWAEELIGKGLAYVDDQDAETISAQRGGFGEPGVEQPVPRPRSPRRTSACSARCATARSPTARRCCGPRSTCSIRCMSMRDPVLYRIRRVPHQRTGDRWIIYPTYDWAHGQSDAHRGRHPLDLHARVRRPPAALRLVPRATSTCPHEQPEQTEFARLNLTHTVMSKRLLQARSSTTAWSTAGTTRACRRSGACAGAATRPRPSGRSSTRSGWPRPTRTVEIELLESFVRTPPQRHTPCGGWRCSTR